MDDRRHVWHDPDFPPHEIVSGDVPGGGPVKVSRRARNTVWVVFWVVLGVAVLSVVLFFGAAVVSGVMDGIDDPIIAAPVTEKEEAGMRGLATTIADRGRRGDHAAVVALGDGSASLDAGELASDVEAAFGGTPIKDWAVDINNVQVLKDTKSQERIIVFRLVLTGTDGSERATNPFYAVQQRGAWRLTGIRGRDVQEILY